MGGWTGLGKDTIIWDGTIQAKNFNGVESILDHLFISSYLNIGLVPNSYQNYELYVSGSSHFNVGEDNVEFRIFNEPSNNNALLYNGSDNFLILQQDSGFVGIGLSSPNHKLHVYGSLRVEAGSVYCDNYSNFGTTSIGDGGVYNDDTGIYYNPDGSVISIYYPTENKFFFANSKLTFDNSSNYFGVNTTDPTCSLDVYGTSRFGALPDNYTEMDDNGFMTFYGAARFKRIFQMSIGAMKGVGTNPATSGSLGLDSCLIFANNLTENAGLVLALPLDMYRSTYPKIRLGWSSPETSGNVKWQIQYLYRSENEDTNSTTPDETLTATTAVSSTANGYKYSEFTLKNPSSTDRICQIRISRLGADAADTCSGAANLLGMVFEYTCDKLGK